MAEGSIIVIVIGGGYSGMVTAWSCSAPDAGPAANRFASNSSAFLSQDGAGSVRNGMMSTPSPGKTEECGRSNRYLRRKVRPVSGLALRSSWPRLARIEHVNGLRSNGAITLEQRHQETAILVRPDTLVAIGRIAGGTVAENHSLIWALRVLPVRYCSSVGLRAGESAKASNDRRCRQTLRCGT